MIVTYVIVSFMTAENSAPTGVSKKITLPKT